MPTRTPAPSNANNLKQSPIPVVPRTMPIVNSDGTVTRSGQLLLEQLQAPQTTYGPHTDRPSATNAPNGSVYIETDRGSIYQNWNGVWRFICGTMWATLNPDQRPTDLGVNDGGFDFRTTDDPAREFIWSQAAWIEATPVRYGTHAARLAVVVSQVIDQLLWVETDRGVIYQLQNGTTWQYLAGAMWGTMSPDQRPTDLGTHDAGFDFRTTDDPAREFIWSQAAWIEATPVRYGTHAARIAAPIADLSAGMAWVETDRGNVIYQNQAGAWVYVAGAMTGTISPDQRPTGLGVNDTGFRFETTDGTQFYRWSGTAWTNLTPAAPPLNNVLLLANSSAALTLTTTATDVPGAAIAVTRAGRWLVTGTFHFQFGGADAGAQLVGQASLNGGIPGNYATVWLGAVNQAVTASQQWQHQASASGEIVKLQGYKTGGTGNSVIQPVNTTITALWVSP